MEVVASLPCYSAENVNAQRGDGVFEKSISALQKSERGRLRHEAATEPGLQSAWRRSCPARRRNWRRTTRRRCGREFGIVFNQLFTITNQPIARFAEDLRQHGQWDAYLELLANSFNPATVEGLMCRSTISVGWLGEVYDCDFNQMLNMQMRNGKPLFLWDVTPRVPG